MKDPTDPASDTSGALSAAPTGDLTDVSSAPAFTEGELLAGRFRVVRLLGQGGMGQVYEAEDQELREHVALKVIRPEIAQDARATERFRREINLARKVTHPNVSRIFDLFRHSVTDQQGTHTVAFITMELLPGETLSRRLAREGAMTPDVARPLVVQMTAGLEAAHAAGVIHRDFKPGNVIVVGEGASARAVVTDFGLASALQTGGAQDSGLMVRGTAAYMAPEQVEGGDITPATDVYALGITLYQMVTGRVPFGGDSSLSTAVKRLTERPASPATLVPGLDPVWERTILRCLERRPADRFARASDVARALTGEAPRRRLSPVARNWAVGGVVALIALAAWAASGRRASPPAPIVEVSPATVTPRRSVALLGFKNLSGREEAAWLSTALAEMLGSELAAGETLRTVSGEEVARAKVELKIPDADSLARDTLGRLRRSLGADVVVLGSYLALGPRGGGQLRLDVRLQDAQAGETIGLVTETGTESGLLDLVARSGTRLREKLGASPLSSAEEAAARASRPGTPEAARLYAEGLARLRLFDAKAARELLEKAVAADPNHPLAHTALSEAWTRLGDDRRAGEAARRGLDLAQNLSRPERLSIEGRERETARDFTRAVEIYRVLWGFFPDDLDFGLRLAGAQTAAGRGGDALVTIFEMRRAPGGAEDPRVFLAEAEAAQSLSDFKRAQSAAARASVLGEARGARHLVARAALEEGSAWWGLGDSPRAVKAYEKARRIFAEAGDRWGVARTVNRLAGVPYEKGDMAGARAMFQESLEISRAIGDRKGEGRQLGNVAETVASLGDLPRAESLYVEAMTVNRESGNQTSLADNLCGLGHARLARGDVVGAQARFEEALTLARSIGDRRFVGYALHGLGRTLLQKGELSTARARHDEALSLRRDLGQAATIGGSQLGLAEVALEEGRAPEGVKLAKSAADEFRQQGARDREAEARSVLARAHQQDGQAEPARTEARRAQELAAASQNPQVRLRAALAAAVAGVPAEPHKALEAVVAEAGARRLVLLELEARLALLEMDARAKRPTARAALEKLGRDADARGLSLLAAKARDAGRF